MTRTEIGTGTGRAALLVASLLGVGATARGDEAAGATAIAGRIDRGLAVAWTEAGVSPSATTDDATFLRRVSLDLIGRIPTVAEARAFLEDRDPGKRARVVGRLLGAGAHARHFATFWRRTWLPQADTPQFAGLADGFERWVAGRTRAAPWPTSSGP